MTVKRATRWAGAATIAAAVPLTLGGLASTATADTPDQVDFPESFTSAYVVEATPEQVVAPDGTVGVGQEGATGSFAFLINSDEEVICWDITVTGLTSDYASPAKTATHIHETAAGVNGPPRISFPNPEGDGDVKTTSGCSEGPFTTGLPVNGEAGTDTGTGFTLAEIEDEANDGGFSADTHTADNTAGAVRGQLVFDQDLLDAANATDEEPAPPVDGEDDGDQAGGAAPRPVPVNGVDTGMGGDAASLSIAPYVALGLLGLTAAGAVAVRRRQGA